MYSVVPWNPYAAEKIKGESSTTTKNHSVENKTGWHGRAFWDPSNPMVAKSGCLRKMRSKVTLQAEYGGNKKHISLIKHGMHMQDEEKHIFE